MSVPHVKLCSTVVVKKDRVVWFNIALWALPIVLFSAFHSKLHAIETIATAGPVSAQGGIVAATPRGSMASPQAHGSITAQAGSSVLSQANDSTAIQSAGAANQPVVQFNPAFFSKAADGTPIDLSHFSKKNSALPGSYRVDVFINNKLIGRRNIELKTQADGEIEPCFTEAGLKDMSINMSQLEEKNKPKPGAACFTLQSIIPEAKTDFDVSELKFDITVPQVYLQEQVRGYVDPKYWDEGTPLAGFVNYHVNTYRTVNQGVRNTQSYLNTLAGVNVVGWRLRYNASLSRQTGQPTHYQHIAAYAQHDITALRSQFIVGQTFTSSDVFDSMPFVGVQLSSDKRMLPDSLQGYAPTVRGIADTNARVSILQNGQVIYETTVTPGLFEINDLYNSGGGDLQVKIQEADGRLKTFVIPYTSVPRLLRPGLSNYSLALGKLRHETIKQVPKFIQGTYQRGLNNYLTLYTGITLAQPYQAGLLGGAVNTPVGAFSADITHSKASNFLNSGYSDGDLQGQNYRLTYSAQVEPTQTNFTASLYHAAKNYLTLKDYVELKEGGTTPSMPLLPLQGTRLQLNANQQLGEKWGSLFLMYATQKDKNHSGRYTTYQLTYSNSYKWGSLSISANRTRDRLATSSTQYLVSINIPFSKEAYAPQFSAHITRNAPHQTDTQLTISGTKGETHNINYSIYTHHSTQENKDTNVGGNIEYMTSAATLNATASRRKSSNQQSFGASGALVFHPGGITTAQTLGESIAIIKAPGAKGAALGNVQGVTINRFGYAVVPYLTPYRNNDIYLNPEGTSIEVELQSTSANIIPRAGAIAFLQFSTTQGAATMVKLEQSNEQAVPVGAFILSEQGETVTMVGQGSRAFLRGQEGKTLIAKWGNTSNKQCRFSYQIPLSKEKKEKVGAPFYTQTKVLCNPLHSDNTVPSTEQTSSVSK